MTRTKPPKGKGNGNNGRRRARRANGLIDQQARFVEEYLIDFNATRAAIRAGYSAKNADKIGSQLLGNPRVSAAVEAEMAKLSARTGVTQERVMRELARIAFVDPTKLIDLDDASIKDGASEDDRAVIQSIRIRKTPRGIEREIKVADKLKALQMLGDRLGMWVKRQEIETRQMVYFVDDVPEPQSGEPSPEE